VPEENVIPLTSDNDAWQKAVALFTGYEAPQRHTLFDKLLGNEGIKQMKVEISKQRSVDYVDPNDFNWRVENAGYRIENTDFVIPFYMTSGDNASAGDQVSMYKARITMLGNHSTDSPPAGGVVEGKEFRSQYENHLGLSGDKAVWTTAPLTQYAYGTGRALEALLNNTTGTHGFSWNGINVANEKAVALSSFDTAAAAFDRVGQFFSDRQKTVAEWQRRVGAEQDDAWRGQAAGVFWNLIHTINRQYEGYAKDMGYAGGRSKQGNELREAGTAFRNAVLKLHSKWAHWELYMGNPLRWLHDLLVEITDHVWERNIKLITYKVNSSGGMYPTYYTTYHAQGGFDQTATRLGKNDNFGPLDQLSTWKAVGERAVQNWQASVIENLVEPANAALDEIHNKWGSKNIDLGSVRTRGDEDLTSSYQEDKTEKEKEAAEKAAAEANRKNEEFMAWQKAEAERARAEAERHRKEQEEKEKAAKAEQERKEAEAKAEQERKEKEARAEQERREKEAEQKQAEAEAKAEQKEAEARAEQERRPEPGRGRGQGRTAAGRTGEEAGGGAAQAGGGPGPRGAVADKPVQPGPRRPGGRPQGAGAQAGGGRGQGRAEGGRTPGRAGGQGEGGRGEAGGGRGQGRTAAPGAGGQAGRGGGEGRAGAEAPGGGAAPAPDRAGTAPGTAADRAGEAGGRAAGAAGGGRAQAGGGLAAGPGRLPAERAAQPGRRRPARFGRPLARLGRAEHR
jgi:hypothetical protein